MKKFKFSFFALAIVLIFTISFNNFIIAPAQASVTSGPTLLKDTNTTPTEFGELNSDNVVIFNNNVYFSGVVENASQDIVGLWKTDGTIGGTGTSLVREFDLIDAGVFRNVVVGDDVFYFIISSGDDYGLWKSDGTEEGTVLIHSELYDYIPKLIHNDVLYFYGMAYDGDLDEYHHGLWKTDGTTEGTTNIRDFSSGDELQASVFVEVNDLIYFIAETDEEGGELWKTDGTELGTELVIDLDGDTSYGAGDIVGVMGNNVYFVGDDSGFEGFDQLWKTDGTELGTVEINPVPDTDFTGLSYPLPVLDGYLYMGVSQNLVRYDGVSAGVESVAEALPGDVAFLSFKGSSGASPSVSDEYVYFLTDSGEVRKIYRSDGTELGTEVIVGTPLLADGWYSIDDDLTAGAVLENNVYFIGDSLEEPDAYSLFVNDGATSTELGGLYDFDGAEWYMFVVGDRVFFAVDTSLYVTDGTLEGTGSVFGTSSADISYRILEADDKAFFTSEGVLWVTDGTQDGTLSLGVEVSDMMPHSLNNELFFWAVDEEDNYELWKSDGTEEGTVLVKDMGTINLVEDSEYGSAVVGDKMYISSYDTTDDDSYNILVSDGTEEGTTNVLGDNLVGDDAPRYIINVNGNLYVITGNGLQKVDIEGGVLEDPIVNQSLEYFAVFDGKLYFVLNVNAEVLYWNLYSFSGTGGAVLVESLASDQDDVFFGEFLLGEDIFYVLDYNVGIWRSDGTSVGTFQVFDVSENSIESITNNAHFFLSGDSLYFTGLGEENYEFWKTDGTVSGIELIENFEEAPYFFSSSPYLPFFIGFDEDHGYELWTFDGTGEGIEMVEDLYAGSLSALYGETRGIGIGDYFIFMADTLAYGIEPYVLTWEEDVVSEPEPENVSSGSVSGSAPSKKIQTLPANSGPVLFAECLPGHLYSAQTGLPCSPTTTSPTTPSTSPGDSSATQLLLSRTLRKDMRGEDVRALQKKLNEKGFVIATTGPGSPGNETSIFGPLTRAAVIKFQISRGLVPDGIVGPLTLAELNK